MLEHSLFHKLPPWNQVELLEQKGVALAQRHHKGWTITLFSYEHHFVEVWSKQGLEMVASFHALANYMEITEPYFQGITLPEEEEF